MKIIYNLFNMKNKLIIVAGSSGSGKSTISKTILENFGAGVAQIVCLDRFYLKDKTKLPKVAGTQHANYDHPDAFDWPLARKCIKSLLNGKPTEFPVYNYLTQNRAKKGQIIKPSDIVILEGTLPLYDQELIEMANLKIYVDTSLDECFIRRLLRDQEERGRSIKSVIKQWKEAVKPMYELYVEPSKKHADLILPWEKININGLEFLTSAIYKLYDKKE